MPGVWLPGAYGVKDPKTGERWEWQWVFPSKSVGKDPRSEVRRRHHVHDNGVGKALSVAVRRAGIAKKNHGAYAAALFCDALAGGRGGYPDGAGITGA